MKLGARSFIAVAGGIDVPVMLGSRSTYGLGAFGGFEGRKLQAGDKLPVGTPSAHARAGRVAPDVGRPALAKDIPLRVLPGLYFHRLQEASGKRFFEETWTVASEADRIGYRYKGGTPLEFLPRTPPFGAGDDPSNIVDAGYPYGSATIGAVISADMDRVAQMQPNHKAQFVAVDMAQALAARAERKRRLDAMRAALAP